MKHRQVITAYLMISLTAWCANSLAQDHIVASSGEGRFEFHIDPWVSLHHFAYHFVRAEERELILRGRVRIIAEDRRAISGDFRTACADLRPAYRAYIEGNLLFDRGTRGLAEALVHGVDSVPDTAVRDALKSCMPAYRQTLWPRHLSASDALLQKLLTYLDQHEADMARRFAATLGGEWPEAPIRVDLTAYANWAGAYTDDTPANITMSSYDDEVSGAYAFEILVHESGHTLSFETSLRKAAHAALQATGLESDRFWHFVLFFAAGRVVAEVLDDPDYLPFSVATGLTEREGSAEYYDALSKTWDSADSLPERVLAAAQLVAGDRQ